MINIVIVTHGRMADGLVSSAKMLIGEMENVKSVNFDAEMGQDQLFDGLSEKITDISAENQYLLMCDIMGGTPFNTACRFSYKNENVAVFYGVNLPVLIETVLGREGRTLVELSDYIKGICSSSLGFGAI